MANNNEDASILDLNTSAEVIIDNDGELALWLSKITSEAVIGVPALKANKIRGWMASTAHAFMQSDGEAEAVSTGHKKLKLTETEADELLKVAQFLARDGGPSPDADWSEMSVKQIKVLIYKENSPSLTSSVDADSELDEDEEIHPAFFEVQELGLGGYDGASVVKADAKLTKLQKLEAKEKEEIAKLKIALKGEDVDAQWTDWKWILDDRQKSQGLIRYELINLKGGSEGVISLEKGILKGVDLYSSFYWGLDAAGVIDPDETAPPEKKKLVSALVYQLASEAALKGEIIDVNNAEQLYQVAGISVTNRLGIILNDTLSPLQLDRLKIMQDKSKAKVDGANLAVREEVSALVRYVENIDEKVWLTLAQSAGSYGVDRALISAVRAGSLRLTEAILPLDPSPNEENNLAWAWAGVLGRQDLMNALEKKFGPVQLSRDSPGWGMGPAPLIQKMVEIASGQANRIDDTVLAQSFEYMAQGLAQNTRKSLLADQFGDALESALKTSLTLPVIETLYNHTNYKSHGLNVNNYELLVSAINWVSNQLERPLPVSEHQKIIHFADPFKKTFLEWMNKPIAKDKDIAFYQMREIVDVSSGVLWDKELANQVVTKLEELSKNTFTSGNRELEGAIFKMGMRARGEGQDDLAQRLHSLIDFKNFKNDMYQTVELKALSKALLQNHTKSLDLWKKGELSSSTLEAAVIEAFRWHRKHYQCDLPDAKLQALGQWIVDRPEKWSKKGLEDLMSFDLMAFNTVIIESDKISAQDSINMMLKTAEKLQAYQTYLETHPNRTLRLSKQIEKSERQLDLFVQKVKKSPETLMGLAGTLSTLEAEAFKVVLGKIKPDASTLVEWVSEFHKRSVFTHAELAADALEKLQTPPKVNLGGHRANKASDAPEANAKVISAVKAS